MLHFVVRHATSRASGVGANLKVLHVIQRYWPYTGGSERHFQEISERLVRRGHQVTVVTTDAMDLELFWNPGKDRIAVTRENHNGVEIIRVPVRHLPGGALAFGGVRRSMAALADLPLDTSPVLNGLARFVPWIPDLGSVFAEVEDASIVNGMNICFESLLIPAQAVARRRNIPFIATPLTHLGESSHSIVRRFYTMPHQIRLLARSDAILAQTRIEVEYLVSRGISRERLTLAGVGVNPSEVLGGDGTSFRRSNDLHCPFVLYLGTAAFDKGTVHLVEAMARLWGEVGGDTFSADLVLAGPLLDSFRQFLDSVPAAVRQRIHVLGLVTEPVKRDLLAAAAIVAMPSRTDSFGIVFLEGWLYDKPVIGARAGGIPDVIADEVDGFLVEFGDVSDLARRIRQLIDDPALASRFGAAGHAKVLSRYTWDQVYPVVEEVYERLWRQKTHR